MFAFKVLAEAFIAETDPGNPSQTLPLPLSCADVHADEHQDRWMQRGLLVLCAELEIRYWCVMIDVRLGQPVANTPSRPQSNQDVVR